MATGPVSRRAFLQTGACLSAAGLLGCRSERISRLLAQLGPTAAQRLGYPRDSRLVIIHADDIGFCRSVNRAATTAFERGAINSGSIMAPCPGFEEFADWVRGQSDGRPMFISDNNGFDWQFINWYFHHFLGENPFGHSSTNLGSLYKGAARDLFASFKHLRRTRHTHHPVDDARGNAEALLAMRAEFGLKVSLK